MKNVRVYHELPSDSAGAVLINGMKRAARGEKGDDLLIIKTDKFLDSHRPKELKNAGVNRNNTIYAYARINDSIVDIVDGTHIPFQEFITSSKQTVLEMNVDPDRCYVSDLDTYDALKEALGNKEGQQVLETLAHSYWSKVKKLSDVKINMIRRPEVMITFDVQPDVIKRISS